MTNRKSGKKDKEFVKLFSLETNRQCRHKQNVIKAGIVEDMIKSFLEETMKTIHLYRLIEILH